MRQVWKIGSRWGNVGRSVLDLFLDYGCVFFGDAYQGKRLGNWHAVTKGDLFVIADGATPVAIGEALGKFLPPEESGIPFRALDVAELFNGCDVVVCPARLRVIDEDSRHTLGSIQRQFRFCDASGAAKQANIWWDKHADTTLNESFSIDAVAASLFGKNRLIDATTYYRVPIYQRPYSWGEAELRRLMEDLCQGMKNKEPIFLGTMQLGEPAPLDQYGHKHSHEIIDGQQRLTTLLLLLIVLESLQGDCKNKWLGWGRKHFRTAVNKRAAQDDLDAAWAFLEQATIVNWRLTHSLTDSGNPYIANAQLLFELIQEFSACDDESATTISLTDNDIKTFANRLLQYMANDTIKIVVIETRAGLSKTLKIFDSINSTGMDLGSEDLFKIHFYEYRRARGDGEKVFDDISEIYEMVADYNRQGAGDTKLSMGSVLSAYQRRIVAENELNASTFAMSQERFFTQLFETMLDIHVWPDFKVFSGELTVKALRNLTEQYIQYLRLCEADPELRIFRHLLLCTRYGYASNYPVLALDNGVADPRNVKDFARELLSVLIPPSLYYAKHVYAGRSQLHDLLKAMYKPEFPTGAGIGKWCREKWRFEGLTLAKMFPLALNYRIADNPPRKNLLCKLVEFIVTPIKDKSLFGRLVGGFDIEHIQSQTPEKDAERILGEWGDEIARIGNLVMLESGLNKSIKNRSAQKPEAYGQSHYVSALALRNEVEKWTKKAAENRRESLTSSIRQFLELSD